MSTGKGWEGDDCTCGRENRRWKGLPARAHREPLRPAEGRLLPLPEARRGAGAGGRRPAPPRVRMPSHKAESLELTRLVQKVSKRAFWGLPWRSSGLRLGASSAEGRKFVPWSGNQDPACLRQRPKPKKKKTPQNLFKPSVTASRRTVEKEGT